MRRTERAAAVVIAHGDPSQVRRLIAAMDGFSLFLHCDRRTPDEQCRAMVAGFEDRVEMLPRIPTTRASWSLVKAELTGLRVALERSDAEHIVVMSGSCYPILPAQELLADLEALGPRSWMQTAPLPLDFWNTPRNKDGGFWRLRRRFVVRNDQVVHVAGVPLRMLRREIPSELVVHGALEWKVYARQHARKLLEVLDQRPDLVDFFRHSFIPDETCAGTILQSPQLVGDVVDQITVGTPWYIEWPGASASHPEWLKVGSFDRVRDARGTPGAFGPNERCLFARKLRSAEDDLLVRIDTELRGRDPEELLV